MQEFKPGQLIRNKKTGSPLFVLHVFRVGVLVTDLSEGQGLVSPKILLQRDYKEYTKEANIESTEKKASPFHDPEVVFKYLSIQL